jgi:hypothetical protein
MNTVKVKREELLKKLHLNRKNHRDLFLAAQIGYRKQVIQELDRMLTEAREGKNIRRGITLPEPEDHTTDYDRTIAMLEMSVEEHIEIQAHEFDMYIMDNWAWKAQVMASNARYTQT